MSRCGCNHWKKDDWDKKHDCKKHDKKDDCCCADKMAKLLKDLPTGQKVQLRGAGLGANFNGTVAAIDDKKVLTFLTDATANPPNETWYVNICQITAFRRLP